MSSELPKPQNQRDDFLAKLSKTKPSMDIISLTGNAVLLQDGMASPVSGLAAALRDPTCDDKWLIAVQNIGNQRTYYGVVFGQRSATVKPVYDAEQIRQLDDIA